MRNALSASGFCICANIAHMSKAKQLEAPRRAGRKTLSPTGEVMRSRPIRMTDAEWDKCKLLGGGPWVRAKVARAKLPAGPAAKKAAKPRKP
jgi:hypothetical protein